MATWAKESLVQGRPHLFRQIRVIDPTVGLDQVMDVLYADRRLYFQGNAMAQAAASVQAQGLLLIPGLLDLHVHFREPGFLDKECIASGALAAFAGGVTSVVVMPNTDPALDNVSQIKLQIQKGQEADLNLMVAGAATRNLQGKDLTPISFLKQAGAVAVTDDGRPILPFDIMEEVLKNCALNDLLCMQHAEDTRLSECASMHEGVVSKKLGVKGQASRAEYTLVDRDIQLAKKYAARYHVLHVSTKESIDLLAKAKDRGEQVSCEVTPHHLLLTDDFCSTLNPNVKMNPPLRSSLDREALLWGIRSGVIDAVASDHAPHTALEKSADFIKAPFGVVGLETAFLALLTLASLGHISIYRAVELMTSGPASVLRQKGKIGTLSPVDSYPDFVIVDPRPKRVVTKEQFYGRSCNSAFLGTKLLGRILLTFRKGNLVFADESIAIDTAHRGISP